MNRKEFLKSTTAIAAASFAGLKVLETTARPRLIPIIDTHQHLWDIKRFTQGWSSSPLNRNFDHLDYVEATRGLNVVKSVYMEVNVPEKKRREEALYAIEMCRNKATPTVAAVIAANPTIADFKSYMADYEGSRYIKGIRYFFKSEDEFAKRQVIENIRHLGEINMSFDFSIPPKWLPRMTELINACHTTRFLVNHCGNVDPRAFFNSSELMSEKPDHDPDEWIKDMKAIALPANVVCKISGVATRAMNHLLTARNLAPAVSHCLDIFGPDRVMFASDWPVCLRKMELGSWVNILKEIVKNRPLTEQKKMFHDNAAQFYRI